MYSKYDPLPGITSPRNYYSSSPRSVPPNVGSVKPTFATSNLLVPTSANKMDVVSQVLQRIHHLEMRLESSEQLNRSLADEVNQLRGEHKSDCHRNKELINEGLVAQQRFADNCRSLSDSLQQLASKVKRNEDQIASGQVSMASVMEQLRRVQQTLMNSQQNFSGRNDLYEVKISELANSLEDTKGERLQMAHFSHGINDRMKALEQRIEVKTSEISSTAIEVKKKTLALEDETRGLLEQLRRTSEYQAEFEHSSTQLKSQVDQRLGEFQGALTDLRNKSLKEETERRSQEQLITRRLNDYQHQIADLQRSQDTLQTEKTRDRQEVISLVEIETGKSNDNLTRHIEEMRRRMQETETKAKHAEQMAQSEKDARNLVEKNLKEKLIEDHRELTSKFQELKKTQKADKNKLSGSLNVLNEGMSSIEKHQDEWFDKLSKSLRAEIKSREKVTDKLETSVEDLDNKFGEALALIQADIDGTKHLPGITKQGEKHKLSGGKMNALDDILTSIEKLSQSLTAEVNSRERVTDKLETNVEDLDHKFGEALAIIQAQIDGGSGGNRPGLATQPASSMFQITNKRVNLDNLVSAGTRQSINDLDTKVMNLAHRVQDLDKSIEQQTVGMYLSKTGPSAKMSATLQQIVDWYQEACGQVKDVHNLFSNKVGPQIEQLEEELKTMKQNLSLKIDQESNKRRMAVEELQMDWSHKFDQVRSFKSTFEVEIEGLRKECATIRSSTSVMGAGGVLGGVTLYQVKQVAMETLETAHRSSETMVNQEALTRMQQFIKINEDINRICRFIEMTNMFQDIDNEELYDHINMPYQQVPTSYLDQTMMHPPTQQHGYGMARQAPPDNYAMTGGGTYYNNTMPVQFHGHPPQAPPHQGPHQPSWLTDSTRRRENTMTRLKEECAQLQTKVAEHQKVLAKRAQDANVELQTLESYLADITLTKGNPTRGIQVSKSVLEPPKSPGLGTQTSFVSQESQESKQSDANEALTSQRVTTFGEGGSERPLAECSKDPSSLVPQEPMGGMSFASNISQQVRIAEGLHKVTTEDSSNPLRRKVSLEPENESLKERTTPQSMQSERKAEGRTNVSQTLSQPEKSDINKQPIASDVPQSEAYDESILKSDMEGLFSKESTLAGSELNGRRSKGSVTDSEVPQRQNSLGNLIQKKATKSVRSGSERDDLEYKKENVELIYKSPSANKQRTLPIEEDDVHNSQEDYVAARRQESGDGVTRGQSSDLLTTAAEGLETR